MRRVWATLLIAVLGFPLIAQAAFGPSGDETLPPCCRRNGKHHCSMMASASDSSAGVVMRASRCPAFPTVRLAPGNRFVGLAAVAPGRAAALVARPATLPPSQAFCRKPLRPRTTDARSSRTRLVTNFPVRRDLHARGAPRAKWVQCVSDVLFEVRKCKTRIDCLSCMRACVVGWSLFGPSAPDRKSYLFHGKVEAVFQKAGSVRVNGEEVKGWMDAMTMDYKVDDPGVLKKLKPGDRIMATVYEGDFVLHKVTVMPSQEAISSPTSDAAPGATTCRTRWRNREPPPPSLIAWFGDARGPSEGCRRFYPSCKRSTQTRRSLAGTYAGAAPFSAPCGWRCCGPARWHGLSGRVRHSP